MKSKIIFSIAIIIGLIVFVGGPLFVQYNHWPQGSKGNGDWLSFWGSYLGIIPSGLIAYAVARYQIEENREKDRKEKILQSLPYFDILEKDLERDDKKPNNIIPYVKLTTSTNLPNMPLRFFEISAFLKQNGEKTIIQTEPKNFGHVFPKKEEKFYLPKVTVSLSNCVSIDRVDISCSLINNHKVFYTWGDGLTGHIVVNNTTKKVILYDGHDKDIKGIKERMIKFDKFRKNSDND